MLYAPRPWKSAQLSKAAPLQGALWWFYGECTKLILCGQPLRLAETNLLTSFWVFLVLKPSKLLSLTTMKSRENKHILKKSITVFPKSNRKIWNDSHNTRKQGLNFQERDVLRVLSHTLLDVLITFLQRFLSVTRALDQKFHEKFGNKTEISASVPQKWLKDNNLNRVNQSNCQHCFMRPKSA